MDIQPSYFGVLPAEVRYNKDITDFAKILYAEIMALSNREGYCFATNKYFADLFGKHKDTVSAAINELKKFGFITVEIIDQFKRKIYPLVSIGVRQKTVGGTVKTPRGIGENTEYNNITNNKNNNIYSTTSKDVVDGTSKKKKTRTKTRRIYRGYIDTYTPTLYQEPENFNWDKLMKHYAEDKEYVLNILAYFCQLKGIRADTWGEARTILGRHVKGAQAIKHFPVNKIKKVMFELNRDIPREFTLETVYKYLTK